MRNCGIIDLARTDFLQAEGTQDHRIYNKVASFSQKNTRSLKQSAFESETTNV